MNEMRAGVLSGVGRLEIIEVTRPQISSPQEVLLRIETIGICGSDLHYFRTGRIGDQVVDFPFIIGHEAVAVVKEVGSNKGDLRPGDWVVIDPALSCGRCDQCRAGRSHTCRQLRFLGCPGQRAGCLQDYLVLPRNNCFKINEEESTLGILVEPIAIAIYAHHLAEGVRNKKVIVLGGGPLGLVVAYISRQKGCQWLGVTDKVDARLEGARKVGADWIGNPLDQNIIKEVESINPEQVDIIFECCGQQEALDQAEILLKPGGKLVIIGIPEADRIWFNPHLLRRKEIEIINVRRQNNCIPGAIQFLQSHASSLRFLITHRYSLNEIQEAFEVASNYKDGVIKAVIDL